MKHLFSAMILGSLTCAAPGVMAADKTTDQGISKDVKEGVEAWEKADYATAIKKWRPAATAGDADAQFNLGQAYKLGWGVPMDLPVATEWFRKAAAQGHLRAEENYALLLFRSGKRTEAMPIIEKSAARGEPRAQYILGTALFNGENIGKDWTRAYAMMTRAVASGLPQATNSLSLMDQYIPLEQRQEATKLAATLEQQERSNMLAATQMPPQPKPAIPPPARSGKPAPVKPADLPPSTIASAPPARLVPAPAPAAPAKPAVEKPMTQKAPPPAPVTQSAPAPAVKVAPAAAEGNWRIQLGAFSDEAKARTLWTSLSGRVKGLDAYQPYIVKDKAITRLQAGPLASQAAALKLCVTVRAAKADCIVKQQ